MLKIGLTIAGIMYSNLGTALDALLRLKAFYLSVPLLQVRGLFKLAFLNCLEKFSTHRKAGNGVKRKTSLAYAATLETPVRAVAPHCVARYAAVPHRFRH